MKPEAIAGNIDKAKIRIVVVVKYKDPNVREVVLNSMDYYVAFFDTVYAD